MRVCRESITTRQMGRAPPRVATAPLPTNLIINQPSVPSSISRGGFRRLAFSAATYSNVRSYAHKHIRTHTLRPRKGKKFLDLPNKTWKQSSYKSTAATESHAHSCDFEKGIWNGSSRSFTRFATPNVPGGCKRQKQKKGGEKNQNRVTLCMYIHAQSRRNMRPSPPGGPLNAATLPV